MPKRKTYEQVKKDVESLGYIMLDDIYVNNRTKFTIQDKRGLKALTTYDNLMGNRSPMMVNVNNPYSIENIKILIADKLKEGAILLDTKYYGEKVSLHFRCACGNYFERSWSDICATKHLMCRSCTFEHAGKLGRLDWKKAKKEFEDKGYTILSDNYEGIDTRIECISPEGFRGTTSVHALHTGRFMKPFSLKYNRKWYVYNLNVLLKSKGQLIEVLELLDTTPRKALCRCLACSEIFEARINNLFMGKNACDKCMNIYSRYSTRVEEWLVENNVEYVREKRFPECKNITQLPFDFYLPKLNICIEVDGEQHYRPINFSGNKEEALDNFEKIKRNDKIKDEFCAREGIKLIRIPYWEFENEKYKASLINQVK